MVWDIDKLKKNILIKKLKTYPAWDGATFVHIHQVENCLWISRQGIRMHIKETVSGDFLLLVFSWISLTPAPEFPIRTVSNVFENSRRYLQVKVHQRTGINAPVANLPPLSTTPVVHLELRISSLIFEKIRNGPNGIVRGLRETDSWKKTRSRKSRDTVSLSLIYNISERVATRLLKSISFPFF